MKKKPQGELPQVDPCLQQTQNIVKTANQNIVRIVSGVVSIVVATLLCLRVLSANDVLAFIIIAMYLASELWWAWRSEPDVPDAIPKKPAAHTTAGHL